MRDIIDLIEGRLRGVPLLYHATDPENAISIILKGRIEALTKAKIGGRERAGLSLTRSASFANVYNSVVFGFDSEMLRRRFGGRMVPHADPDLNVSDNFHADYRREAEEFLMADLPLNPFLVGLWISKNSPYVLTRSERNFFQKHPFYAGIMTAKWSP